ncbi:efflux RND transporter periplasmic adaptor subunit [Rhodopila globiformis]|uniref:Efflux transporter periplasmic adaptor subunit n=1 Tax=Rhodopila globiformis TaxID=1071 RepID=A0A2S6NJ94_RHOGL|nr:efflux RND transporter periplasmic adaptor subunit [Rhodopila globiformis]PPQ34849.1 efflux transporter periplasmic adaptor subunit [Rhodopila globiformis]
MTDTLTLPRSRTRRPRTWLRMGVMLLVMGLLGAGLYGFQQFKGNLLKKITATIRSDVPTVATAPATLQPWQPKLTAVGSARALNGADLAAEIGGVVDKVLFESGQDVAAGTVLVRLRPNDDDAKLAQLQANAELAAVTLARDEKQLAARAIARATVDSDVANLKVARAQVAAQQAVMAEKVIRAPFAGRLGVRQVDVGQYVSPGTTLVTLQQLDPMLVDFYLPQQALGQVAVGLPIEVTTDAWPGRVFNGKVSSLNAKVDPSSRMLQVRATIPNADGALLPGMFLNVAVVSGAPRELVTIPLAAVAFNPYGSLVYVVHDEKGAKGAEQHVVTQQFVTTGDERGDQVSILKGLSAHDVVVTAGQMKLHNKSVVKINNAVQPTNNPAPVPQDH